MPFDYMGVAEFARLTGRGDRAVRKMVHNGVLLEAGYRVERIRSRTGKRETGRWAIGVPQAEQKTYQCDCPACGNRWQTHICNPSECPSCGTADIDVEFWAAQG